MRDQQTILARVNRIAERAHLLQENIDELGDGHPKKADQVARYNRLVGALEALKWAAYDDHGMKEFDGFSKPA